MKRAKLQSRFKHIGNCIFDGEFLSSLKNYLGVEDLCILTEEKDREKVNGAIGLIWTRVGLSKTLKIMNAYELIEIYLGHNEEIKSIFDLRSDILILMYGYGEFENARQSDILVQTIENRKSFNCVTCLINRGREIPNKLNSVKSVMESLKYSFIKLGIKKENSMFTR